MPVADDSPGRAVRSPPPRLLAPLLAQEVYDGQEVLRPCVIERAAGEKRFLPDGTVMRLKVGPETDRPR